MAGRRSCAAKANAGYRLPQHQFSQIPAGEVGAFRDGLNAAGFAEGHNVMIDYRFADGNYDRLPAFAVEFVARPVDVIVAS